MSYKYSAICDVCGFKYLASELRRRWDGFMVCPKDWEPRNILDLYRPRNDTHQLPWTRPDDTGETTWTPTVTNVTGSYTMNTNYMVDVNSVVTFHIQLIPTTGSVVAASATFTLPTGTVSTDRHGQVITSLGRRLGQVTNGATIAVPNFTVVFSPLESVLITGSYIKA